MGALRIMGHFQSINPRSKKSINFSQTPVHPIPMSLLQSLSPVPLPKTTPTKNQRFTRTRWRACSCLVTSWSPSWSRRLPETNLSLLSTHSASNQRSRMASHRSKRFESCRPTTRKVCVCCDVLMISFKSQNTNVCLMSLI